MSAATRFGGVGRNAERTQCVKSAKELARTHPGGIDGEELGAGLDIYFRATTDRKGLAHYILQECTADSSGTEIVFSKRDKKPLVSNSTVDNGEIVWQGLFNRMRRLEQRALDLKEAFNTFNGTFDDVIRGAKVVVQGVPIRVKQAIITNPLDAGEQLSVCLTEGKREKRHKRTIEVETLHKPEGQNEMRVFATVGDTAVCATQIPEATIDYAAIEEAYDDVRRFSLRDFQFTQDVMLRFAEETQTRDGH